MVKMVCYYVTENVRKETLLSDALYKYYENECFKYKIIT